MNKIIKTLAIIAVIAITATAQDITEFNIVSDKHRIFSISDNSDVSNWVNAFSFIQISQRQIVLDFDHTQFFYRIVQFDGVQENNQGQEVFLIHTVDLDGRESAFLINHAANWVRIVEFSTDIIIELNISRTGSR